MDNTFKKLEIKDGPCTVREMELALLITESSFAGKTGSAISYLIELCKGRTVGFNSETYPWDDFVALGIRVMNKIAPNNGDVPDVFRKL